MYCSTDSIKADVRLNLSHLFFLFRLIHIKHLTIDEIYSTTSCRIVKAFSSLMANKSRNVW